MKKYLFLLLIGMLWASQATAQTLAQARALYQKGAYAEAKPTFAKLLKSQPGNGNYNLWYGVCCLYTGEASEAVRTLETAVKKRIPSGQFYLAQAYNLNYQFAEAVSTCEDYLKELTRRRRPTEEATRLLEKNRAYLRMLKGVEQVTIVDSFVVDKANLLSAYRISPESGNLYLYDEYFKESGKKGGTVYQTELGNKLYYSELQTDSTLSIVSSNKMLDRWSQGSLLPDNINKAQNTNYPFVLTDGVTIYFAADGENSIGGYDIYVTRYNTNTDSYLNPESVGMPFNSPYNDYLYVVDEYSNLGWFASDRFQPEGRVCVYLFIPNSSKQVYDYESMNPAELRTLAKLDRIAATQTDAKAVADAHARLEQIGKDEAPQQNVLHYDFEFIVNDQTIYHQLSDFRSPEARTAFQQFNAQQKNFGKQCRKLNQMRDAYHKASPTKREQMAPAILDLEKQVLKQDAFLKEEAKKIRKLEADI